MMMLSFGSPQRIKRVFFLSLHHSHTLLQTLQPLPSTKHSFNQILLQPNTPPTKRPSDQASTPPFLKAHTLTTIPPSRTKARLLSSLVAAGIAFLWTLCSSTDLQQTLATIPRLLIRPRFRFPIMPSETLPPAPEMFSRWGAFQTWWGRTNKEQVQIAEARLLSRLQFFSFKGVASTDASNSSTQARVGLVPLSGKNRQINTLIIHQNSNPSAVDTSEAAVESKDQQTDDQGRTPIAQTRLDIKTATDDESMISPPASGERAIVVCHGYGAGLAFFFRNYLSLSQIPNSKIYAIDWLGMGGSSRPAFHFKHTSKTSIKDVVRDSENFFIDGLEEWRQIQKIEKMVLVGHSLGGYLSTAYALKYPERVEKLILVSPVGIPENPEAQKAPLPEPPKEGDSTGSAQPTRPPSPQASTPNPPPASSWVRKLAMGAWERNITPQSIMRFTGPFGPSLVAAYTSRRFAHLEDDEQKDLNNYIYHISSKSGSGEYALATILAPGAYARWPLMDRLKDLTMPTAFLYGESDWMDYRAAEKARRLMTVPTVLMRIPNAGHHLYLDNPPAFDKAVLQVITRPWDQRK